MNFRDAILVSAYLDGKLSPHEAQRLEARLAADAELRRLLEDLRLSRRVLQHTPRRAAPRKFTLRPQMKQLRAPEPRAVPVLRFASVFAGILLVATFAFNTLARSRPLPMAAAPVAGYGSGGGGAAAATEQPLQSFAAPAPATGPSVQATQPAQDLGAPTPLARVEAAPKQAPPGASAAQPAEAPQQPLVPAAWQLALGVGTLLCALLAWLLLQRARRNFRSRWLDR